MILSVWLWQLLGAHAFMPFLDGLWSSRLLSKAIGPRDRSPADRSVSIRINERQVDQLFFGLNVTFGTPPQEVILAIQSRCPFETWVPSRDANYTNATILGFPENVHKPYIFDANASSTAQKDRASRFLYRNGPNLSAEGHYLTDNGTIGGISFGPSTVGLVSEGNRIPGDICFNDIGRWLRNATAIDDEVYSVWLNGPGLYHSSVPVRGR